MIKWNEQQLADAVRVIDALPNLDFTMTMGLISDVPAAVNTREQYALLTRNTTKPHIVVCDSRQDLEDVFLNVMAAEGAQR